jgi:hypothetical protein
MWGLAIGAAMGGGVAALRGGKTEDILKGAAIGGATGAIGGGISSLMPAATGVTGAATVANAAPAVANLGVEGAGTAAASAATASPTASSIAQPGFFESGFGKTLYDNKGILGAGALGLMALKPQSSSNNQESDSYIRPHTYDPSTQTYTAQTPIKASDFGTRSVAEGGIIGMAEGGMTTEEQRQNTANPTLEALSAIQQQQPTYQPPAPQGITQPLIQPQMAQIQQQYAAPQRQAPAAFQYQAPSFTKYANTPVSAGASTGLDQAGINALYQEYLGRDVDPTGLSANKGQSADAIRKSILDSAEYKNRSGGTSNAASNAATNSSGLDASGINSLYQQYLGRAADPTGLNVNKGQSADVVKQAILASPEYKTNNPSGSIGSIYQELLGRAPDPTGIAANAGQSEQVIRQSIMASPEYLARYPTYNNPVYDYGNTGDGGAAGVDGGGSSGPDGSGGDGGAAGSYAMGGGIGSYYPEPDDGNRNFGGIGSLNQGPQYPMQSMGYAMGGQLGGYSDGGQLLRGPGDGVSDDIPAQIGDRQPARLADGEFVVPARIVSELGNGSTDAGAKRLYSMMDRIQKNRGRTVGKGKVAVNSRSDKYLPA